MTPSAQYYAHELLGRLVKIDRQTPIPGLSGNHRVRARILGETKFITPTEAIEAAAIVNAHAELFPPLLIARMNGKLNP